jgi:hypothetical protein
MPNAYLKTTNTHVSKEIDSGALATVLCGHNNSIPKLSPDKKNNGLLERKMRIYVRKTRELIFDSPNALIATEHAYQDPLAKCNIALGPNHKGGTNSIMGFGVLPEM